MEQPPIVSVCLITYNHESFIRQAIEGVLLQKTDYKYELIIADDYSKDHTREIIKDYANKYPDIIKLILQERNVGPARNWIDLISVPKTKYIAYFEGDDYWVAPNKLQNQIQYLEEHNDYIACCGNAVYIINGVEQEKVRNWPSERDISTREFLLGNDVITGTILFRNQLSSEFFKMLENAYAGDWILFYFLSKKGKFYYTQEVLTAYRIHSQGAWNRLNMIQRLRHEKRMKTIFLKDNIFKGDFTLLLKEIVRLNLDLIKLRTKNTIRSLLGRKLLDSAKQFRRN